jgi:hypothetical protein
MKESEILNVFSKNAKHFLVFFELIRIKALT